jgi:MerR family copper efflux transcriptional regulator
MDETPAANYNTCKLNSSYSKKVIDYGTGSTVYNLFVTEKVSSQSILRSAEFARMAGVSTDTLRHYERKGLLKPKRSRNGYREYTMQMLERVRLIRRAVSVGFTIDELHSILKARDKGDAPCRQVHKMAQTKLEAVENQLRELENVRDDLRSIIADWNEKLAQVDEQQPARLLEALANRHSVTLKSNASINKPSLKKITRSKKKS